jgi:hypothetical protein
MVFQSKGDGIQYVVKALLIIIDVRPDGYLGARMTVTEHEPGL